MRVLNVATRNDRASIAASIVFAGLLFWGGCATSSSIQQEKYAPVRTDWTLDGMEFYSTWKAIESAMRGYKVRSRDPDEVSELDLKKLRRRSLETEWIYGRSRDKYIEVVVNEIPSRKYVQTRFRFRVLADQTIPGTHVRVDLEEEVENLNKDGSSAGYESTESVDTALARELLEKIKTLAAGSGD